MRVFDRRAAQAASVERDAWLSPPLAPIALDHLSDFTELTGSKRIVFIEQLRHS
ncbi:hypothetical protein [Variovorax sp. LT1R16]|uniref:hypothetical protein n=1 Tax=Variovorax sp. LT1R16 TaxID=3443728 RepID=UPI003F48580A